MRVLIVEDDPSMARLVDRGLTEEGYAVDVVDGGMRALAATESMSYDALVLDVALPDIDGFEVCARLRRRDWRLPVLMLTARDTVQDRIRGFDAGADDYLGKPFSFAELCVRVRALVRRGAGSRQPVAVLEAGRLRLEPLSRRVWRGADEVHLSPREYLLIELLIRRQGTVVTRSVIHDHVWGPRYPATSNVVDQYVGYLRRKLGRDVIETVRGAGYRLSTHHAR